MLRLLFLFVLGCWGATCPELRSVLSDLYVATNGPEWAWECDDSSAVGSMDFCWFLNVSSSHKAFNPCNWKGVSCYGPDVSCGHTTLFALALSSTNMKGKLPQLNFSSLEQANVGGLQSLYIMHEFGLRGSIAGLLGVTTLRQLTLSECNLVSSLVNGKDALDLLIESNPLLEAIDLSSNQFQMELPPSLCRPSLLQRVSFQLNIFGGNFSLCSLSDSILELDLSFNRLRGFIPKMVCIVILLFTFCFADSVQARPFATTGLG